MHFMAIPIELFTRKQWVLWNGVMVDGRVAKVPISPWSGKRAACNQPQTWSSYRHVRCAQARYRCAGIGFVFTADDPYCGIDLDHCCDGPGELAPWAQTIVGKLSSYAEWSPSGSGVHMLVRASLPESCRHRATGLEVYDRLRYFTVTGKAVPGMDVGIANRQQEINELLGSFGLAEDMNAPGPANDHQKSWPEISDQDLLLQARCAANGAKFTRLWTGDLSDFDGDHSRADAALCALLAFYTQGNRDRIDRLFRASALYRDKWNRSAGQQTYGQRTIERSLHLVGSNVER
jgi:primase-polymerase (primpol)-like protein